MLKVGDVVPDLTLIDAAGASHALRALKGKRAIITFYVKDSTPACTQQVCEVGELASDDVAVLAIGPGTAKTHAGFAKKIRAASKKSSAALLLDEPPAEGAVPPAAAAFGAWGEKQMYGKKYMGVLRSTFVVSPAGVIEHVWPAVKAKGHAEEVRAVLGDEAAAVSPKKKPAKRAAAKVKANTKSTAALATAKKRGKKLARKK